MDRRSVSPGRGFLRHRVILPPLLRDPGPIVRAIKPVFAGRNFEGGRAHRFSVERESGDARPLGVLILNEAAEKIVRLTGLGRALRDLLSVVVVIR